MEGFNNCKATEKILEAMSKLLSMSSHFKKKKKQFLCNKFVSNVLYWGRGCGCGRGNDLKKKILILWWFLVLKNNRNRIFNHFYGGIRTHYPSIFWTFPNTWHQITVFINIIISVNITSNISDQIDWFASKLLSKLHLKFYCYLSS